MPEVPPKPASTIALDTQNHDQSADAWISKCPVSLSPRLIEGILLDIRKGSQKESSDANTTLHEAYLRLVKAESKTQAHAQMDIDKTANVCTRCNRNTEDQAQSTTQESEEKIRDLTTTCNKLLGLSNRLSSALLNLSQSHQACSWLQHEGPHQFTLSNPQHSDCKDCEPEVHIAKGPEYTDKLSTNLDALLDQCETLPAEEVGSAGSRQTETLFDIMINGFN